VFQTQLYVPLAEVAGVTAATFSTGGVTTQRCLTVPECHYSKLNAFLGESWYKKVLDYHAPQNCTLGAGCCHEETKALTGDLNVCFFFVAGMFARLLS
jgi:hypothetical protein